MKISTRKNKGEELQGEKCAFTINVKNAAINVTAAILRQGFSGQLWFWTDLMENQSQAMNHKTD